MTGKYGTPDRHPERDEAEQSSKKPMSPGIPPLRPRAPEDASRAEKRQPFVISPPIGTAPVEQHAATRQSSQRQSSVAAPVRPSTVPRSSRRFPQLERLPRWVPRSWQFWSITLLAGFIGLGTYSAATLFFLPDVPNCPAIFLPTASASMRLYCAQMLADKRTVEDLLKAITLVDGLPADHPLRPEIDRNINNWSQEILKLAEELFQNGELDKAIGTAKRIPAATTAHQRVEQQIKTWQEIWGKAEKIYQDAEADMQRNDLRQAFLTATRLLAVGNTYWETTKYQELTKLITDTRVDGGKLDKARGIADEGGVENVLAALKLMEEVKPESHLYKEATTRIGELGRQLLDLADAALDRQNYTEATRIVAEIPDRANLKNEIQDFKTIAQAKAQSWGGTVDDLQAAIVQAQKLKRDRPLFGEAQQLISRWQLEIQDVARLERARQIAEGGTVGDLSAAVAEAQQIPAGNPRGQEAQEAIDKWTDTIQTVEDRPYLDRADQYASGGDIPALQRAINEASRIGAGRALYADADQRIRNWTDRIQRIQDQPILDQARALAAQGDLRSAINVARRIGEGRSLSADAASDIKGWTNRSEQLEDGPYLERARLLANQGDLPAAIATAEQIQSGRALYDEAQADIQTWRSQSDGQDRLQQAYNAARIGTSPMLVSAIQIADEISSDSPQREQADRLIEQWSYQILQIAESQAQNNPSEAIAIAEGIPEGTAAYSTAQQEIQSWRQQLRR
ncbi:chromosome segregation ATPase [Phormidium tenue FACHB-886]|nr:chromosome segregation ATPase [Phormidium tenue FACHB-886]